MSHSLDQLCRVCGMLPWYNDIWGNVHSSSDASRRALLRAMRVPADTDEEIAASLHAFERRRWERTLPPVQVVREAARPYRIVITCPVTKGRENCRWHLRRESGGEDHGEFIAGELEEVERAYFSGQEYTRRVLALDLALEPGYHGFSIERNDGSPADEMRLIVAPATCYLPPAIREEGRVWGLGVQLYGVRSARNYGIGDFSDLARLVDFCTAAGGGSLLLNPLHALFPDAPEHASPYSPSSRVWFNPLYLDVEAVADFAECEEARALVLAPSFQARLRALRAADQVDYTAVAEAKSSVLHVLHRHFRDRHLAPGSERGRAFRAFQREHGRSLRRHALFEALQEHFRAQDGATWGWPVWPEAWRDPDAPEVHAFCAAHLDRVEYFEYLQWQAVMQLQAAGTRPPGTGLGTGVMLDLAIGVAEGGGDTWARRGLYALDASVGAPPDDFNPLGQNWGLPPWIPHELTLSGYDPFIEILRANMRDRSAMRIDHIMGLRRLFWIARGLSAADGTYVLYPFEDMLGILALESQRHRCLVVGEDLGTVSDDVRDALRPMNVMSTRLLYFERYGDGKLKPPREYPVNAVAAVTTHDLPTLTGFWQGRDLDLRDEHHLFPDDNARNRQIVGRAADRAQLLVALEGEGVLPASCRGALHPVGFPEMTGELAAAVYTYLARAPSKVLLVQAEDALGVREQPNLPGTTEAMYPSWRLKLPLNLDKWDENPYLQGVLLALRRERPVPAIPVPAAGEEGQAQRAGVQLVIPRATYRLQLNSDFRLSHALELLPYLDELGISHCYLSPVFKARPGSRHGYDVTDHGSLNPEIGTTEDFEGFAAALRKRGMGQILDLVPNHMCISGADNHWWLDVLENGPASRFASYFDIDWYVMGEYAPGRVLLPVLGDHYGATLRNGELRLAFDTAQGMFSIAYLEHRFPVDPREYPRILGHGLERLQARLGAQHTEVLQMQSLMTAFSHLPSRDGISADAALERARDNEIYKRQLAVLAAKSADIEQFIRENVSTFNREGIEDATDADLLHELIEAQAYRLAFWRAALDEINYRRFFDINDLAALRMDNPEVFESTHRLVRQWLAQGHVDGLRIDHPDGLYAPGQYFGRLQAMAAEFSPEKAREDGRFIYIVAEKILASHEQLPASWPIHGTTGYDFAASCGGLFVDGGAADRFTRIHQRFLRARPDMDALVRANKHMIMENALAGELQVLATQLARIAKGDRDTCDFTFNSLHRALAEVVANFPVYRTYVADCESSAQDARYVEWATGVAKRCSHAADGSVFDFVRDVLLAQPASGKSEGFREAVCTFAMKFQQYTGPVMAKAMEDTTFYQYSRLASLNEVGSDPHRFGVSVAAFHGANQARAARWPHAMLSTSSHDNKRSEDVRARISVLSEMPERWRQTLASWSRLNRGSRRELKSMAGKDPGSCAPSRNDEYLLYQTLLGIWPFQRQGPEKGLREDQDEAALAEMTERVCAYMLKAGREAKMHSSWTNPDIEYEKATEDLVRAVLAPRPGNLFLRDFLAFQQEIARKGAYGSLSQLLLKLTAPGVPDIYQGNEIWDFSLVDPDNRRAVDYAARRTALREIKSKCAEEGAAACAQSLLENMQDGRIKLYLTWKTLAWRREHEQLFREGSYVALKAHGQRAGHACAFARRHENGILLVIVPRLFDALDGEQDRFPRFPVGPSVWGDTWLGLPRELARRKWTNVLTGENVDEQEPEGEGDKSRRLELTRLFGTFPYALLHPAETGS